MRASETIERARELRDWLVREGESDPELQRSMLEGEADIYRLLDWAVGRALDEDALAEAVKSRQGGLADRKKAAEARAEKFRSIVRECMEIAGEKSYRAPDGTVSLKTIEGRATVTDEKLIPEDYWRVSRDIDKNKINEDFKKGVVIPGVSLGNGGISISIRSK